MKSRWFYMLVVLLAARLTSAMTMPAGPAHDALGRRISAAIGTNTIRYYYDGSNVIEERDGSDNLLRYHVNGGQYIDERVATCTAGSFSYYYLGDNYSPAGTGNASGTFIQALTCTAGGDPTTFKLVGDIDGDGAVILADLKLLVAAWNTTPGNPKWNPDADLDGDGAVILADLKLLVANWNHSNYQTTGQFGLQGRPVDVINDSISGKKLVLQDFRARLYDIKNGRWLQRDPAGYINGGNLYEAFGSNAATNLDPSGESVVLFGWQIGGGDPYFIFNGQSLRGGVKRGLQNVAALPGATVDAGVAVLHAVNNLSDTPVPHPVPPAWEPGAYVYSEYFGVDIHPQDAYDMASQLSAGVAVTAGTMAVERSAAQAEAAAARAAARAEGESAAIRAAGKAPESTVWTSPKIVSNAKGQLTNGPYTLDEAAMQVHTTGSLARGKSQFLFSVDEKQVVLDAAAYADKEGLWLLSNGSKAKVVLNQPIGVVGETGELTNVINLYRTKSGFVHGAPGTP